MIDHCICGAHLGAQVKRGLAAQALEFLPRATCLRRRASSVFEAHGQKDSVTDRGRDEQGTHHGGSTPVRTARVIAKQSRRQPLARWRLGKGNRRTDSLQNFPLTDQPR